MLQLKGYIGLSSSSSTTAPSGLYVDALPDISVCVIDAITTDEGTSDETWSRIEDRAILKFRTLFISEVNKTHKVSDIEICECLINGNRDVLATALWYLLGAEVMLSRRVSSRINAATIDRNKPKELRDYFEDQFKKELSVAVASIDIHKSPCFQDCKPDIRDVVTFHTSVI